MLTRDEKAELVEGLKERFSRHRISIFTDIRGISVAKLMAFRRELKKIGAELKMAKKTLLKRALETAGIGVLPKELEGEVAVIFGYEDQVSPAKVAAKFSKENKTFRVLKGILAGNIIESGEVLALAKLPPKEQLLGHLAQVLNAPIQQLANALQGNIRNLVVILNQVRSEKA